MITLDITIDSSKSVWKDVLEKHKENMAAFFFPRSVTQ